MSKQAKLLILCPYPTDTVGSQRFRFEQYYSLLNERYELRIHSFYSERSYAILYKKGHYIEKTFRFLTDLIRMIFRVLKPENYKYILVHRGVLPVGPPLLEWWIKRIKRIPLIYDFDDAIWLKDDVAPRYLHWLKNPSKVANICAWSSKVSCGNQFLVDYASKYNEQVVLNPTTIDQQYHIPVQHQNNPLVVGWTGTHSNLNYLLALVPMLQKLHQQISFKLLVICNHKPEIDFADLEYIPWNKATEIADLNRIDIGLMPLTNSSWAQGKCGFKILQYMALQKVAVAAPVGVNKLIIKQFENGILCQSDDEWLVALKRCLSDPELRTLLGKNGRNTVLDGFSVSSNSANFLSLFT